MDSLTLWHFTIAKSGGISSKILYISKINKNESKNVFTMVSMSHRTHKRRIKDIPELFTDLIKISNKGC